jgi:hypothetical protein
MPLFGRRKDRKDDERPEVPEGYVAVHHDELDEMLEEWCNEVCKDFNDADRAQYLDLAFLQPGLQDIGEEDAGATIYLRTACALGYHARIVEVRRLGLEEDNPYLSHFLVSAAAEQRFGNDWWATMNGAAAVLAIMADSMRNEPAGTTEEDPYLGPEGLGADARARFAMLLLGVIAGANPSAVSDHVCRASARSWKVGYHLRVCEEALPAEALAELGEDL